MDRVYIGPPEFDLVLVYEEYVYDFEDGETKKRVVYQPFLLPVEPVYVAQMPTKVVWRNNARQEVAGQG